MVLLNIDAGEHDDEPEELWALADILSVACGGHAGDERSMTRVVTFCAQRHQAPRLGAHPSYPDREGFGRTSIDIKPESLRTSIAEQCGNLAKIAAAHRQRVQWMKPHGALYHDADKHLGMAYAAVFGARDALGQHVNLIGPADGKLEDFAYRFGPSGEPQFRYLREGFADRATRPDGSLVPRTEPNALITDPAEAAAQARKLMSHVGTICIHSDTPNALAIARAVREVIDGG